MADLLIDLNLRAAERAVIERAAAFARASVADQAARWEAERAMPLDVIRAAGEAGLCGLIVPRGLGGEGLGFTAFARVVEELASADLAFAFSLVVHNNLAGNIARNGTPEQIERYLPDLIAARRLGAFLLTEPTGGSDAAAIKTRAVRDGAGGGWRIDGAKAWVSNGAAADVLSVYAQTDPAAGWRGIACFLIDADRAGVVREPAYGLLGGHALGTNGFRFEDCRVDEEALLLAPGEGFKAAMRGIDVARVNVAAMCAGMMRAALDHARRYVARRAAFGQRVADFQGVQWMLADALTDLEASRLLAYNAAALLDGEADAVLASAHAKKFATRAALTRIADCMQVMGAAGYRDDAPLARHLATAKMAQYLDGATEIQNVVISRRLFSET